MGKYARVTVIPNALGSDRQDVNKWVNMHVSPEFAGGWLHQLRNVTVIPIGQLSPIQISSLKMVAACE
jgi:hypothetical protein